MEPVFRVEDTGMRTYRWAVVRTRNEGPGRYVAFSDSAFDAEMIARALNWTNPHHHRQRWEEMMGITSAASEESRRDE